MTPEAQRIAIAEFCGFTFRDETWSEFKGVYDRHGGFIGLCKPEWLQVPRYTEDLNAMHEAIKRLSDEKHARFRDILWTCIPQPARVRDFHSPEAPWLAEALLRTIGKWL